MEGGNGDTETLPTKRMLLNTMKRKSELKEKTSQKAQPCSQGQSPFGSNPLHIGQSDLERKDFAFDLFLFRLLLVILGALGIVCSSPAPHTRSVVCARDNPIAATRGEGKNIDLQVTPDP